MKYTRYILVLLLVVSLHIEKSYSQCIPPQSFSTSVCRGSQVTLPAVTNASVSGHRWYTTPTGGSYLTSGVVVVNSSMPYVTTYTITCNTNTTYYVASVCNNGSESARSPIAVTILATPTVSITTSNDNPANVCALNTGSGKFTLTATSGSSYQWKMGGNPLSGATTQNYYPTQTGSYTVVVGTSCGNVESSALPVTVVPATTLTASISGSDNFCSGTAATYTASVPGALTSSVNYQWYLNDNAVGTNSSTYSSSSIVQGDRIKCTVSLKSGICATPSSVTSNVMTITVNSIPAAPIVSGATSNCGTQSLSLSAWTLPPGTGITLHWYTSPSGSTEDNSYTVTSTSPTYVTTLTKSFSSTTTYYVAASNACGTSARTAVTATVNPTPTINITPSDNPANVCSLNTGSGKFTLTATSGSSYQWKLGGSPISGATGQTYNPTQTGSYTVAVGTTNCGIIESSATSVTIVPATTLTASISGSDNFCSGTTATYTASVPGGLTSSVNYQWYLNDNTVGTNSSTYSSSSIVQGDRIKCTVSLKSGICATPSSVTSNVMTITVNSIPAAPIVSGATSNCGTQSLSLSAWTPPGTGITLHWYTSPSGSTEDNSYTVTSTSPTYVTTMTKSFSATTTYYVAASNACGTSARTAVTATVNPAPIISITPSENPTNVCSLNTGSGKFTLTATSGSSYQWKLGGSSISGATAQTYNPTQTGSFTVVVGTTNCGIIESSATSVTVVPATTLTASISGSDNFCSGTAATYTASVPGGLTSSVNYQWYLNDNAVGTNSSTYSSSTIAQGDRIKCTVSLKSGICATPSSVTSNVMTITVNSIPAAPIVSGATSNCGTQSLSLSAWTPPGTGITLHWYTSPSGSTEDNSYTVTSTSPTYVTTLTKSFSSTTTYYVAASNACGTSARTAVTATVNPTPTINITPSDNPANVCSLNTGSGKFTLTATSGSSYQWKLGGSPISGATSQTYNPTQTGSYTVAVETTNCGIIESSATSVTVVPATTLTASISGSDSIIYGTTETYTVSVPTDLISQVNYQWYINDTPVGTNSSTFSSHTFNRRDKIKCVVSSLSSGLCISPSSIATYEKTLIVNKLPAVDAGEDKTINLPTQEVELSGTASDADGSIQSYSWSQTSGPTVTLTNTASPIMTVVNLTEGTYIFKLTVVDNENMSVSDNVTLTVASPASAFDHNFVRTTTLLTPGQEKLSDLASLSEGSKNVTIQYFDGLGRLSQTVQRGITPSGADLVAGVEYDAFGRDYRHWLPGSVSGNSGAYVTDFGTPAINTNGGDSIPYTETIMESSPLNRPLGQHQPGADWYTHPTGIDYKTNAVGEVIYFSVENNQLKRKDNYDPNTLYKTTVTDEDKKTTTEFKDKQGQVVLKRQLCNGENVDTYYVYNDLSQLSYVIPPKAVDELTSDLDDNNEILKQYCYLYRYDTRGNCIYKRLPGCEPIYMVYDKTNKLLLSQDGNQRPFSKWTMNKYDILGRVIYTAVVIDEGTTYEEELERFRDATVVEWYNTPNAQSDPMEDTGYSRGWYDAAPTRLLTVNYYDDYSFLDLIASKKASLTYDASKEQEGYTAQYENAKGLLTGTRTYHLDDSTKYEAIAFYYDKYGRVVQTRASNHLLGYDITYNALDFRGKVLKSLKEHNILGQAVIPEVYRYAYDKAERLIMTRYKLGTNDTITLASNTYDELGRIAIKNRGGVDTTSYTYNVRGWTTDITGSRFTENLYYNVNKSNAPVFTPSYNGNIAGMQWTVPGENLNYTRTYNFVYDELNRFMNSIYYKKTGNQFSDAGRYDEGFSYDKMGNIDSLFRYENGHLINDLSFTYTGNQLKKVDNAVNPFIPYGSELFKDSINANIDTEYDYDKNGSMISDLNTGISTIQYNILNLPDQIQFIQGHKNLYTYDASGKKLKAQTYSVNNKITVPIGTISTLPSNPSDYTKLTTDYVGNMIYENGSLKQILLPEGYYQGGVYYYYLIDHLGNNRLVINSSGAVIEKSNYYPSGMRFSAESTSNSAALPYRYNGKELEAMNGLNQYDYGARRRGAGLPIWTARDMFSEKYYSISPYVYCNNNPVNAVDPDGKKILFVNGHWEAGLVGSVMGSSTSGKSYWSAGFTEAAKKFFKDESKITASNYIDGSSEWGGDQSGSDRYNLGYNYAKNNYKSLVKGMKKGETFKLVTHSEGSAYGAGIAEYLIQKGMTVETVVHLSADEGDEFTTPNSPKTYQLGYNGDWVTGNKEISGTDMFGIVDKYSGGMDKFLYSHGSTKDPSVFNEVSALLNMALQGASAVNVTETASGTKFTIVRDNNQKVDGNTGAR